MKIGVSIGTKETLAIAQNATAYSSIIKWDNSVGYSGMLVSVSAGSVTITQQCGFKDQGLFYDPVDETNAAIGAVITTMGAGDKYIQFSPVPANFVRFKVVEANVASTTVNLTPIMLEER